MDLTKAAKSLQSALRNYEEARQRLLSAAEPNEIKSAAENMIAAKKRFKRAQADFEAAWTENLGDELSAEDEKLLAIAKGEGGHPFTERVDAYLKVNPEATASDVADVTQISLQEVIGIFEQRKAEAGA